MPSATGCGTEPHRPATCFNITKMNPKLSIVIPVYNVRKYLAECVASVQAQHLRDYEIILVDDGSTDGSGAMCDEIAATDPARIRVVHKANAGLGMARNTGIEAAEGRYITFLDSDDTIHPQAYSACIEALETNRAHQARFRHRRMTDGDATDLGDVSQHPFIYNTPELMRNIAKVIFGQPYVGDDQYNLGGSACMAVYRLDIIRDNGVRFHSERELLSEDYVFNYDYCMVSDSIVWIPREYYNYRVVESSLTNTKFLQKMERAENFCRFVTERMHADGFGPADDRYAHGYCIQMLRVCGKSILADPRLSGNEKRAWFNRYVRGGYFCENCRDYPLENMTLPQKLFHLALCKGRYRLACIMAQAMRLKG